LRTICKNTEVSNLIWLKNWNKVMIKQKDLSFGCIPTGMEWLIRYLDIEGIELKDFQEEFNLKRKYNRDNTFESIKNAINMKYPQIKTNLVTYEENETQSIEKIGKVKELISKNIPLLFSLTKSINGGWHVMPVIGFDDEFFYCIRNSKFSFK